MKNPKPVYVQVNLNNSLHQVKINKSFKCGDPVIDHYLRSGNLKRAVNSENLHATAVCNEHYDVVGFMTVGFSQLAANRVKTPKGNQPKMLAVAKVFMIGIDQAHQGKGLGTDLMLEAFEKAVAVHLHMPLKGIFLDAAPGKASFYATVFGFKALDADCIGPNGTTPMFIPIENVIAALMEVSDLA
ncbi:N-acetyltransferase [Pseudomonas sp. RP23018S]|uniref:GNAT family N-acetyltransferase n=1 Tax=Pseudomonas sp. RP23018S TaxID=3096037 RepID=UPI002ACA33E5|nr:GNAT family N-acetyltransferase [Pseudomonas sp. RP23018S]MDZ5604318.1 N-acetyltransferase [Pseudomonas sp. RP23018S]